VSAGGDHSNLFTPGPSFDEAPAGDRERQAIDALRGYAYQVAVSAIAWVDLDDRTRLYLEVAEDYATIAGQALNAMQVNGRISRLVNPQRLMDAAEIVIHEVKRHGVRVVLDLL
jgi:hypothetical protein